MFLSVCVPHLCGYPKRPKEAIRSLRPGITDGSESPDVGSGN